MLSGFHGQGFVVHSYIPLLAAEVLQGCHTNTYVLMGSCLHADVGCCCSDSCGMHLKLELSCAAMPSQSSTLA